MVGRWAMPRTKIEMKTPEKKTAKFEPESRAVIPRR